MNQTHRHSRKSAGSRLLVTLACWLVASSAVAHIVPPEQLHPVAESYRRNGFVLALNPVLWDLVIADTQVIAKALGRVAEDQAKVFEAAVQRAVTRGREAGSGARQQAAAEIFEASTRAVASLLSHHLERARGALTDRDLVAAELDEARQLWSAFEREIRLSDHQAFVRLGLCWLELYDSLGSPGLGAAAGVPVDGARFVEESEEIVRYLRLSYIERPTAARRLKLPLPIASPTFEEEARLVPYLPPGTQLNKQLPRPRQVLNMVLRGVDESATNLIALGDMAFDSPQIFGDPARSLAISCNTCHNKSITNPQLFIPGLSSRSGGIDVDNAFFAPHANDGVFDPLDVPDLRGIRFTAPYGRDGRFASLREFTRNVIVNEFNGAEPEPVMLDGLIAYMLQFDFLPNPELADDGSLIAGTSAAARRGEQLFRRSFAGMGNRSCATCHVASDHFLDRQRHDIGSVAGAAEGSRDGALDTPTLLSSTTTAPYFHDGSLATLRAVVEWFDDRFDLALAAFEVDDLTAYLELVGSGVDAYEDTIYTLEAELEEFSFFLSTWDFLVDRGEERLVAITMRTVADEIRAHKWDVQDRSQLGVLDRLAGFIDQAGTAFVAGKMPQAEAHLAAYKSLYTEHREVLK